MPRYRRLLFFVLIMLLSASCTVEKRLYNGGWHISRKRTWKCDGHEKIPFEPAENSSEIAETPLPSIVADTAGKPGSSSALETSETVALAEKKNVMPQPKQALHAASSLKNASRNSSIRQQKATPPRWSRSQKTYRTGLLLGVLAVSSLLCGLFLVLTIFGVMEGVGLLLFILFGTVVFLVLIRLLMGLLFG